MYVVPSFPPHASLPSSDIPNIQLIQRTSVYRPNLRAKSDADIIRDAKLEAMGLNPEDHEHTSAQHHRSNHDRPQMATDEMVCCWPLLIRWI